VRERKGLGFKRCLKFQLFFWLNQTMLLRRIFSSLWLSGQECNNPVCSNWLAFNKNSFQPVIPPLFQSSSLKNRVSISCCCLLWNVNSFLRKCLPSVTYTLVSSLWLRLTKTYIDSYLGLFLLCPHYEYQYRWYEESKTTS